MEAAGHVIKNGSLKVKKLSLARVLGFSTRCLICSVGLLTPSGKEGNHVTTQTKTLHGSDMTML